MCRTIKICLIYTLFLISLCSITVSCASSKLQENTPPVRKIKLTMTKRYILLQPEYMLDPVSSLQLIEVSFKGHQFSAQVFVQADTSGVFLTLLNSFGTSMGELDYTPQTLSLESAFFPVHINPAYIIADFQFCYYDACAVAEQLGKSNLRFTVETRDNGGTEIRRIYMYKRCIEEITRKSHFVQIVNHYHNYSYTLQEASE
jgi:hypothetical protein